MSTSNTSSTLPELPISSQVVSNLRSNIQHLSNDYWILRGEFGSRREISSLITPNWLRLEERTGALLSVVRARTQRSGIFSRITAHERTEYASLVTEFNQARSSLTALRVQLEGPGQHRYAAGDVVFRVIGYETHDSRASTLVSSAPSISTSSKPRLVRKLAPPKKSNTTSQEQIGNPSLITKNVGTSHGSPEHRQKRRRTTVVVDDYRQEVNSQTLSTFPALSRMISTSGALYEPEFPGLVYFPAPNLYLQLDRFQLTGVIREPRVICNPHRSSFQHPSHRPKFKSHTRASQAVLAQPRLALKLRLRSSDESLLQTSPTIPTRETLSPLPGKSKVAFPSLKPRLRSSLAPQTAVTAGPVQTRRSTRLATSLAGAADKIATRHVSRRQLWSEENWRRGGATPQQLWEERFGRRRAELAQQPIEGAEFQQSVFREVEQITERILEDRRRAELEEEEERARRKKVGAKKGPTKRKRN